MGHPATSIRILDSVLIENIKCCGHDALWKGHFKTFKKLAEHNVKEINKLGVETIITTCAECYRTLKVDYPKHVENANFNVIHLSELISDKIKNNKVFIKTTSTITGLLFKFFFLLRIF